MLELWELGGLNDCRFSTFSWRTRLALHHKGLAFVLHPVFGGLGPFTPPLPGGMAPYTGTVEVTITPVPAREQRIVLLLNRTSPAVPSSYSFVAERRASGGDPVVVPLEDLARGEYFVRVQVNGAESPLDLDPASASFGPTVAIP